VVRNPGKNRGKRKTTTSTEATGNIPVAFRISGFENSCPPQSSEELETGTKCEMHARTASATTQTPNNTPKDNSSVSQETQTPAAPVAFGRHRSTRAVPQYVFSNETKK
jgi:hypothetical protein